MRNLQIASGEYYHICNRGNDKQDIFLDDRDRARFILLILGLQSPYVFRNISRLVNIFLKQGTVPFSGCDIAEIIKNRYVELSGFMLMTNHFHLLLKQGEDGGVSRYIQRLLNAYTKYFNTKYGRSGHLFQGAYRAVHIEDNEQLLYSSAYLHRNCRPLDGWKNREDEYPWSSFQDYTQNNRWGDLLCQSIIIDQFEDASEYKNFVDGSGAKDDPFESLEDTLEP